MNKSKQVSVTAAEAILADIEAKRTKLVERGEKLDAERKEVAYAALAGDAQAQDKLRRVIDEAVKFEHELKTFADAVAEAQRRVDAARADEASRADRLAAQQLIERVEQFVALAEALDKALATVVETSSAMGMTLNDIHALGQPAPTGQQWLTYGEMAMQSALMQTPWARSFRHLAPRERRNFTDLAKSWASMAQRNAAARLGEGEAA